MFPHKTHLRKRLEVLYIGIVTDWVAMGFAMAIAAFSQWGVISIFHLTLCSYLGINIPAPVPTSISPIVWRSKRLKIIYFISFRILRLAASSYLIYRSVRLWSNNPGQCFIPSLGTTGGSDDGRLFAIPLFTPAILADTYVIIATLVRISKATYYRSRGENDTATEVEDVEATVIDNEKTQDTVFWTKRKKHTLIFFASFVAGGFFYTICALWIINIILANRAHILEDENVFSFGQITPLVMLGASFYRIWDSFFGRPLLPS